MGLELGDHPLACFGQPLAGNLRARGGCRGERGTDHPIDAHGSQLLRRLLAPGRPLLGLRPGLVLRLAGLEVRTLRERDRLLRGGAPSVPDGELLGQLALAVLDVGPASRPPCAQRGINTGDLPHRALAARPRYVDELDAEAFSEVGLESGVVGLRRGDDVLVQHGAVYREPLALSGLDLVRHRHMGVQIGIAGAGAAVEERRRDQAAGLDLAGAAGALAREDRMRLQEVNCVEDRGVVGLADLLRDLGRRHGPQCRNRLCRRERQIESGHRPRLEFPPQRGAGHGVAAVPEQVLHLLVGDDVSVPKAVDAHEPRPDPTARRLALRGVVVSQRHRPELGRIGSRDLAGQVLVPRPGRELLQRHRHTPQGRSAAASGHPDSSVKEVCLGRKGEAGWSGDGAPAGEEGGCGIGWAGRRREGRPARSEKWGDHWRTDPGLGGRRRPTGSPRPQEHQWLGPPRLPAD